MVKGDNESMGRGAVPGGGAEVCSVGNARTRWRAAGTEVSARSSCWSGGGAVGQTDNNHTESISVQNEE